MKLNKRTLQNLFGVEPSSRSTTGNRYYRRLYKLDLGEYLITIHKRIFHRFLLPKVTQYGLTIRQRLDVVKDSEEYGEALREHGSLLHVNDRVFKLFCLIKFKSESRLMACLESFVKEHSDKFK